MDWLQPSITLGSIIAAIFAWVAKIYWSKEYIAAKDEIISTKGAHIQQLKDQINELMHMTPMKLKEYLKSTQEMLGDYNDQLKNDLEEANHQIRNLNEHGANNLELLESMQKERAELLAAISNLEATKTEYANSLVTHVDYMRGIIPTVPDLKNTHIIELLRRGYKIANPSDERKEMPGIMDLK